MYKTILNDYIVVEHCKMLRAEKLSKTANTVEKQQQVHKLSCGISHKTLLCKSTPIYTHKGNNSAA